MSLSDAQLWHLLHALDDRDHLEFPAGYNHRQTRDRFEQLARRLDVAFDCQCSVDRHVQDASLHGSIEIPATATTAATKLIVSISNFGGLAVRSVDNPGAWTNAEAAKLLHPDDAYRIDTALAELGYILIPEEPLWQRYDGVCDPAVFAPRDATWWVRYFDYL